VLSFTKFRTLGSLINKERTLFFSAFVLYSMKIKKPKQLLTKKIHFGLLLE